MSKNTLSQKNTVNKANERRLSQLSQWLEDQGYSDFLLEPASQDASFRRYYRLSRVEHENLVVMDAPPAKESLSPFIEIAQDWLNGGISVPEIYDYSRELGFLVLQDFGSDTFLNVLSSSNAQKYYKKAIDQLIKIQKYQNTHALPAYSGELLLSEMQLYVDWFLIKHCNYQLSENEKGELHQAFLFLKNSALEQKSVTVHRDYHSRNLMVRNDLAHGVIDFQDAVHGPISYDLVSLLKDCYIKLEEEQRGRLMNYYLDSAQGHSLLSSEECAKFKRHFDLMGAQRHLKAIGIFARLHHRDGKPDYLKDIPRTASYIMDLKSVYPELNSLVNLLAQVLPTFNPQATN